jgi:hypothetical protein
LPAPPLVIIADPIPLSSSASLSLRQQEWSHTHGPGHERPCASSRSVCHFFPHLPLRRREDTSIDPTHRNYGSSRRIWRDRLKCRPRRRRHSCQGQQRRHGRRLGTRSIFGFIFLRLRAHLLDKDSIRGLDIRVPFCCHGSKDQESCVRICLTGQEEEVHLLRVVINLVSTPSFSKTC